MKLLLGLICFVLCASTAAASDPTAPSLDPVAWEDVDGYNGCDAIGMALPIGQGESLPQAPWGTAESWIAACGENTTIRAYCQHTVKPPDDLTCMLDMRLNDGSIWLEDDRFTLISGTSGDLRQFPAEITGWNSSPDNDPEATSYLVREGDDGARFVRLLFVGVGTISDPAMITYLDLTTGETIRILLKQYLLKMYDDEP